ncbi:hypothetical protein GCM10023108_15290 [Saccharopolyspora hordei]
MSAQAGWRRLEHSRPPCPEWELLIKALGDSDARPGFARRLVVASSDAGVGHSVRVGGAIAVGLRRGEGS